MAEDDSKTAYGVFKPVGHVLVSFPTEQEARGAIDALKAGEGALDDDIVYYSAAQMMAQTERDVQNAGILASIGQELNLVKARQVLAQEGHSFITMRAKDDDQARRIADIARRFGADRAQQFGRLIIEELIEPGTGERQVAESPDRGLDPQTQSGHEAGTGPVGR